jgi:hypothetical protein
MQIPATQINPAFAGSVWEELQYTEITAPVSVSSTSEASPTACITGASLAVLAVPTLIEVMVPLFASSTSGVGYLTIWEDTTEKGRITSATSEFYNTGGPNYCMGVFGFRYTPTAGSKVYKLQGHVSAGAPATLTAGAGGVNNYVPAYLRILQLGA